MAIDPHAASGNLKISDTLLFAQSRSSVTKRGHSADNEMIIKPDAILSNLLTARISNAQRYLVREKSAYDDTCIQNH